MVLHQGPATASRPDPTSTNEEGVGLGLHRCVPALEATWGSLIRSNWPPPRQSQADSSATLDQSMMELWVALVCVDWTTAIRVGRIDFYAVRRPGYVDA